jgi:flagellar biosynthesis GTPase FlhF
MTETVPQAVETPAPDANVAATPETETPTEAAPSPAVEDTDELVRVSKGASKRIDELTRNWREAQRQNEALLQLLQRDRSEAPREAPKEAEGPKSLADFAYDEAKYSKYLTDQISAEVMQKTKAQLRADQDREESQRRLLSFRQKETKFEALHPDYRDVAYSAPITNAVADLVMALDDAPDVVYFLGKNPDVAAKLGQLSPAVAGIELGRIEARLSHERASVKPKVSAAPAPPPTIEAAGDPVVERDPSKMTDAEFAKWRRRQIAQRR